MTKREKRTNKFLTNPGNVRYQEMESFLVGLGFRKRQNKTSHAVFTYGHHPPITVPVPHKAGGASLFLRKNLVQNIMVQLEAAGLI